MKLLERIAKKVRISVARINERRNDIEVINFPSRESLIVKKSLGWQEGINIIAKIQPDVQSSYFEINVYGKKIPFDLEIQDSRFRIIPGFSYYFNKGKDIGIVANYLWGLGNPLEFYSNGREKDTANLAPGGPYGFNIRDYKSQYLPLIKSLELRLGRKVINENILERQS